jgi:hypothetical protein
MPNPKRPPKKQPVVRLAASTAVVSQVGKVPLKMAQTPVVSPAAAPAARREAARAVRRQRARALVLLRQIGARKSRIARDFWLIGEALRELLRDKLYVALGHQSFEEMLLKRNVVSLATAKKLIGIAEQVPREQALALGPEKAHQLVRYTEWTEAEDTVAELVKNDAVIEGKPVSQATTADVQAATQKLRKKKPAKPGQKAEVVEVAAADKKLRAFLKKHGLPSPKLTQKWRTWVLRLSVEDIAALG